MKRLSIRWANWEPVEKRNKKKNDEKEPQGPIKVHALVVGSGYGGAVATLRLAEQLKEKAEPKGTSASGDSSQPVQVVTLERGSELLPGEFPNDLGTGAAHVRLPTPDGTSILGSANGLFDFRAGPGVASLLGNGLGGGSLINAGVLLRPETEVFAQDAWPEQIRHSPQSDKIETAFETARGSLLLNNSDEYKTHGIDFEKADAFERLAKGVKFTKKAAEAELEKDPEKKRELLEEIADGVDVTIDMGECIRCGDCATGCNVDGAKLTLRHTYLEQAVKEGNAQLLNSVTVYSVRPKNPGKVNTPWLVRVVPTEIIGNFSTLKQAVEDYNVEIEAQLLVLSAGTYGSVEILQRSKAMHGDDLPVSPALGNRFSGNGDNWSASVDEKDPVKGIGVGADTWREKDERDPKKFKIGPTITRVIDMRSPKLPLEKQLIIEEGAIPGGIGALYSSIMASAYTGRRIAKLGKFSRHSDNEEALGSGVVRGDGNSLAERSQLLLTMGHDQSRGRILWMQDRDASVPYFESPEKLATYRTQAEVLTKASRKAGGRWTPTPLWEPIPDDVASVMSGPPVPKFLTTVHPLGGAVMGDDPADSVVDHVGRVWRFDAERDESAKPFESLYVLDGSIIPTSLGCNPLWTITAMAERALTDEDAGKCRLALGDSERRMYQAPEELVNEPKAAKRESSSVLSAYMEERLTCDKLEDSFWDNPGKAELEFKLKTDNWVDMWDCANHPLNVEGTLKAGVKGEDGEPDVGWHIYTTEKNSRAQLLIGEHRIKRWVLKPNRFLRGCLTTLALRSRDWWPPDNLDLGEDTAFWKMLWLGLKYQWGATEVRYMRYRVELQHKESIEVDSSVPQTVYVFGKKRIDYAATWVELFIFWYRWCVRRVKHDRDTMAAELKLRDSFLAQASNLYVWFTKKDEPWLKGWRPWRRLLFTIDFSTMVERLPIRLDGYGDLPNALMALMEYPLVMLRYMFKTRAFDLRAPDYSGIPLVDNAPLNEVRLETKGGRICPDPDQPELTTDDGVKLKLWRYKRPDGPPCREVKSWYGKRVIKAKSVLLVHAFGQSGLSYTLPTIKNPAAELYEQGYEVWVLEHRLSTRLAAHQHQCSVDDIAKYDIPAAVDRILEELGKEPPVPGSEVGGPTQIFAFAQCVGAAATTMSLLSGKLCHRDQVINCDVHGERRMPKLAGLFISQTHPHSIGQPMVRAKSWLPAMLRDAFKFKLVPFSVRNGIVDLGMALADRVFAALPIPSEERCPRARRGEGEDANVTCRRIRFIEAPLFKHENLNRKTHDIIGRWMGDANVQTFAHTAKWVTAERLVDEDGLNRYVTDENFYRYLALPVCFLHGEKNELFHPEGAYRSARQYARVLPEWSEVVGKAIGFEGDDASEAAVKLIKGYGHVDVLVGKNAAKDVFELIAAAFDKWFEHDCKQAPLDNDETADVPARVHFPGVGPMVGSVQRDNSGQLSVQVSFSVDDRFSDVTSRVCALARLEGDARFHRLKVSSFPKDSPSVRMAHGSVPIDHNKDEPIDIECLSVHERIDPDATKYLIDPAVFKQKQVEATLVEPLIKAQKQLLKSFASERGPDPTASAFQCYAENPSARFASVTRGAIEALDPARTKANEKKVITVGVGSCRYPGFRVEHRRVDKWLSDVGEVDFGLLLGDQIYADATAGFADEMNPRERFFLRHRFAFNSSRSDESKWLGDWLRKHPVFMTPDDHEFHDAYPDGPPFVKDQSEEANDEYARMAKSAVDAYQLLQIEPNRHKTIHRWKFNAGPARFIILDTRSERTHEEILSKDQLEELEHWLLCDEAEDYLNVICTGSVLMPGKVKPGNPVVPGRRDNFQRYEHTRKEVVKYLLEAKSKHSDAFRFLALSGDYHIATAARVTLSDKRESSVFGACITAPPLYSSMSFIDSAPETMWGEEKICGGLRLLKTNGEGVGVDSRQGNGMGVLKIERASESESDKKYKIELSATLIRLFEGRVPEETPPWVSSFHI